MKKPKNKYSEEIKSASSSQSGKKSKHKKKAKKQNKEMKHQRTKDVFDNKSYCGLNFLAARWLHSRLTQFRKDAIRTGTVDRYSFVIPVLHGTDRVSYVETWMPWYTQTQEQHTQRECIDLCIAYLEDYLLCESDAIVGLTEELEIEQKGAEKAECAFAIFGKILPAMWVG